MLCPCLRLRIWSRETALAVPSRVSLLVLYTPAESGAYSRDSSRFPRRHTTPSGQSRVYRVTYYLRTDGVHCRESAGIGSEVLKVVPVTDASHLCVATMNQFMCASLLPQVMVQVGAVKESQFLKTKKHKTVRGSPVPYILS